MKKSIVIIVIVVLAAIGYFILTKDGTVSNTDDADSGENISETTRQVPATDNGVDEMIVNPNGEESENIREEEQGNDPAVEEPDSSGSHSVVFDGTSYSPNVLNIKKGDTVTWVNESSRTTWPASAVHPIHTVYPATGGCIGSTLDACKALENGESFSFIFDEVGTWKMHDHRAPFITMTVVVAE